MTPTQEARIREALAFVIDVHSGEWAGSADRRDRVVASLEEVLEKQSSGHSAQAAAGTVPGCLCERCEPQGNPFDGGEMRFIVCAICGNKRCPHATDHRNACTNSNKPGQKGSSWEHYPAPGTVSPVTPQSDEKDVLAGTDKPWPFTGCAGPLTDCDMKDDAGVREDGK